MEACFPRVEGLQDAGDVSHPPRFALGQARVVAGIDHHGRDAVLQFDSSIACLATPSEDSVAKLSPGGDERACAGRWDPALTGQNNAVCPLQRCNCRADPCR
jgi:hypothetical protein